MKTKYLWTLFALAIVLLLSPSSAAADAAPPPPPAGSDIYPSIGNTNVRMVSEYVLIDIAGYSPEPNGHANVTATFYMQNMGDETEYMNVRFPMFQSDWYLPYEVIFNEEWCVYSGTDNFIEDIKVKINEVTVSTDITSKTFLDQMNSPNDDGEAVYFTAPCWAYFDVEFPPGETVEIEVSYGVAGYDAYSTLEVTRFPYILKTGAAWFDTIGKAEIVARLPYEATDINILSCSPDCSISGTDITWTFEDFEPEQDIRLNIVTPEVWLHILDEQKRVVDDPADGEAWGRLAKAYKEILIDRKGILYANYPPYEQIYTLSQEAYQNTLALLPDDVDWHFGYAELICQFALWNPGTVSDWLNCATELETTYQMDPTNEMTIELIKELDDNYSWHFLEFNIVEIVNGEPVFTILTATPYIPSITPTITVSYTPTITLTITLRNTSTTGPSSTPTSSTPAPTSTRWPTYTPRLTATATPAPSLTISPVTPTPEAAPAAPSPALWISAAGIMVVVIAGLVWLARRKA